MSRSDVARSLRRAVAEFEEDLARSANWSPERARRELVAAQQLLLARIASAARVLELEAEATSAGLAERAS